MSLPDREAQDDLDTRHRAERNFECPTCPEGTSVPSSHLSLESRVSEKEDLGAAFGVVYGELRRLAQHLLRSERPNHTLAATGLVHEAYLRLKDAAHTTVDDRTRFFNVAARAMRQILIEHARRRLAVKRGGRRCRTTLDEAHSIEEMDVEEILALNDALDRLGDMNPRLKSIVEYRFFCGLEQRDIAGLLGVSERTVERDWTKARAWLYSELFPEAPNTDG